MAVFRIIFFVLGLLTVHTVMGQERNSVKSSLSKNRLLIGEPVELTIESNVHPTSGLSFVEIDTIPHFEILERPGLDSSSVNDELTYKAIYKITSFDSGHWVIPSFVLSPGIMTDSIPIDVVFSEFDPGQDYHDIKDIIEVMPPKNKKWWWYAIGGGLILLLALYYFLRKKKPIAVTPQVLASIDPYEEAMKELEQLRQSKPGAKELHLKLTNIFRLYIYRKKGILSLQKTTDDLVLQLKALSINKEQFDKLAQALRLSDFVKFAKYIPAVEDNEKALLDIRDTIINIEKKEAKVLPPAGERT